jgi:hypothetical protein
MIGSSATVLRCAIEPRISSSVWVYLDVSKRPISARIPWREAEWERPIVRRYPVRQVEHDFVT